MTTSAMLHEVHPHDPERYYQDRGDMTLVMPDGSLVSVSKRAPFELAASMSIQVYRAHALVPLREWEGQPNEGNYYCPRCTCRKNGYWQEPNGIDPGCENSSCPCHEDEEF